MESVILRIPGWIVYLESKEIKKIENCGKWMFFFDENFAKEISRLCKRAVESNTVLQAKHTDMNLPSSFTGVACFYINGESKKEHYKVLKFFLENNLIPKNKNGNYRNIAFKFDEQTRMGEYRDKFISKLNLSDFVDVKTGLFLEPNND